MDSINSSILISIFNNIDVYLVILARLIGFFVLLPVFSSSNIPRISKMGLIASLSFIIMASGVVKDITYYNSLMGLAILIGQEIIVGLVIGFVVYMVFAAIYFAGQLMDFQIGLSMVSMFDPVSQLQVPIVGNLYYFVIIVMLVQSGGLNSIIGSISYSYTMIQPGQAVLMTNTKIPFYIFYLAQQFTLTGISIAMPIIGSILMVDVSLGLLVKAVPQMNVFVVGVPIKLLVGIIILYIVAPVIGQAYNIIFDQTYAAIMNVIGGIAP